MASIYASVALIRRNGAIVFKPPRKERPTDGTQARKAAQRFWAGSLAAGDVLEKVILVREYNGRLEISERPRNGRKENPWVRFCRDVENEDSEPHISACIKELGIKSHSSLITPPDILIINGVTYRRDL
ncbi:hypothetical protein EOS93_25310 [Rhizobium sp. RMa-01]|uniref:hypothetical protein n=1 Tax=unclassified Rhizobium TaxID=2613769 RepID=UPI0008DAAEC1|nr:MULTISPECIES: hypothetical protein [unclassified Rhizobium]OHV24922.1 hypothetical protein BBJ66_22525 [Rhizobium sp. RSm-3]RVU08370.1 hypothetical protein EOS93_25310 [Rhizobium sp. RMa-01]